MALGSVLLALHSYESVTDESTNPFAPDGVDPFVLQNSTAFSCVFNGDIANVVMFGFNKIQRII